MKRYIYYIKNKINNKYYIGETKNFKNRISDHFSCGLLPNHRKQKYPLYQDILKYGKESFEYDILEEVNEDESIDKEEYYIKKYDSYYNGYNMTPRSYIGGKGWKPNKEQLKKMTHYGKDNGFYGKKHNQSTKNKIGQANSHPVKLIHPNGEIEIFSSMKKVNEKYNELTVIILDRIIKSKKEYKPKKYL